MAQAPMGGTEEDYKSWALEVPGVTRVWVYAHEMGTGTVTLRFVRDADVSIIPGEGEVATVKHYVDARRPIGVKGFYVVAPTPKPVNFDIRVTPATDAVKAAVEASLRDLIGREAVPGQLLLISHIREAISTATGEADH